MSQSIAHKPLKVVIDDMTCTVTRISDRAFYERYQQALPIEEPPLYYWQWLMMLEKHAPQFNHPRLYVALSRRFGESDPGYDYYKCSFSYSFQLQLQRETGHTLYLLHLTDVKGNLSFFFRKCLETEEEHLAYPNKRRFYPPFPDFTWQQMCHFMTWFTFFLVGFMEVIEPTYDEPFVRKLVHNRAIYGFADGVFFETIYEDWDAFHTAVAALPPSPKI